MCNVRDGIWPKLQANCKVILLPKVCYVQTSGSSISVKCEVVCNMSRLETRSVSKHGFSVKHETRVKD